MSLSSLSVRKKLDVVDPCYNIHLYNCYLYMAVIDHLKSALNVQRKTKPVYKVFNHITV